MKTFNVTGDYPSWTYVGEIGDEMREAGKQFAARHPELAAQRDPLEPLLLKKFPDLDIDLSFCFRCLDRNAGWVSKARMYKNDAEHSFNKTNGIPECERTLGFDIVLYTEDFQKIKNDKAAQKLALGQELMRMLRLKLPNYTKKIPMTKDEMYALLSTIEDWLLRHAWLPATPDEDQLLQI